MKGYSSLACLFGVCVALVAPVVQSAPAAKDSNKAGAKPSKPGSVSDIAVVEVKIPQSVFEMPKDPKAGRDPFFPNSSRPYGTIVANKGQKGPEAVDVPLTLNGIIPT